MNGAQWLVQALLAEGVEYLFGYPGGAIMPFYDALYGSALKHILTRHEQGAAFAAGGYARASGRVGVCVATSGPGATNLLTGIADALFDSVPLVAITGQVASHLMGTDAFQEVNVYGMSLPAVKHSFLVRRLEDLPSMVREAFHIARSGRPGPVLIDIPRDVQLANADHLPVHLPRPLEALPTPSATEVQAALELLRQSKKPLIYGGGGIVLGEATQAFRAFVETAQLPTALTLKGMGSLFETHPLFQGMLGMHGSQAANLAVQECDLLVVVGARFDDRVTGKLAEFAPHAQVIHLDADPAEFNKLRTAQVVLHGDLRASLETLRTAWTTVPEQQPWRECCQRRRRETMPRYDAPGPQVYAPALLKDLSERLPQAIVSCDVGQHQMWVAQHWRFTHPRQHLTSGSLGAMGFGLPAALGAQLACPELPVVCVSGDGSILMNIQELATLRRYGIPVKVVLLDNQRLGMVKQWQELFFEERYSETDLSDNPDFVALAEAFGIKARFLEASDDLSAGLQWLLETPGAAFLHVAIDAKANVWPLVPPNHNNTQMLYEPAEQESHALPG